MLQIQTMVTTQEIKKGVKALVDGMTDAGLWSDDNHEIVKQMAFQYGGTSGRAGHYKLEIEVKEVHE